MDWKKIVKIAVGASGALALLGLLGINLGLPAVVNQISGYLLIAGGIFWGMDAFGKDVL